MQTHTCMHALIHTRGEGMATISSVLAWEIPWTEEPGGLQSMGLWRVRHDLANNPFTHFSKETSHLKSVFRGQLKLTIAYEIIAFVSYFLQCSYPRLWANRIHGIYNKYKLSHLNLQAYRALTRLCPFPCKTNLRQIFEKGKLCLWIFLHRFFRFLTCSAFSLHAN